MNLSDCVRCDRVDDLEERPGIAIIPGRLVARRRIAEPWNYLMLLLSKIAIASMQRTPLGVSLLIVSGSRGRRPNAGVEALRFVH
jgi:hypothetical protein